MKLFYITTARVPSERAHSYQILKVCEGFAKNNVEVNLILAFRLQTNKKLRQIKDIWSYYEIEKRFRIIKLPSLDLVYFDLYTKKASHLRFVIRQISFAFFATIYSLFKKADIYYTRDRFFAFFFGSLKFLHGKKIYYEAHTFKRSVGKLVKKGWIDGLIVITHKLKEFYMKEGIPEEKILVAPDGVDLKMFDNSTSKEDARRELHLPPKSKIIGYVGQLQTMEMEKGTKELIEAFKTLKEQRDDLILCFVGGPDERIKEYVKLAKKGRLEENVIFTGQKPPNKVPLYMKAFDICVMPFPWTEHYAYYMSPLKLFEYMASKRPIVASDLPSVREILNEENAVLVEPGNPKALAEGIEKVLSDEELASKIAEKAYEDVQEFSWEGRARRILEFINTKIID